jgi:hypothetical protein
MDFDIEKARGAVSRLPKAARIPPPLVIPEDNLDAAIRADFRVFLVLLWRFLGMKDKHGNIQDPSPLQLSIAWYLQHGPDRAIIMAFRGAAKSYICAAFVLWLLYCDPQKKVLVVSGSLKRSIAFTNFCLTLIRSWPLIQHLTPGPSQRSSASAFDVGPAIPDQSPSFHAAGVLGQIVGFRADIIVPDDVETNINSLTATNREKIREAVKEFDSILKPGGRVVYLGTPHDEESLYNELRKRGYKARCWPCRYPKPEEMARYEGILAPFLANALRRNPELAGKPAEPGRFPDEELDRRLLSLGAAEFALQFMLDTSLASKDQYPLRLADLLVMKLADDMAPNKVTWGAGEPLRHLQPMGFDGDFYYGPAFYTNDEFSRFSEVVGFVDGSGRGADETALAIVGELHGTLYLLYLWGSKDGFSPATLTAIAQACVRFRVSTLRVEANFGDGMLSALLRPYVARAWEAYNKNRRGGATEMAGTELVDVRQTTMSKERRILSIMEPLTQAHRLVVAERVIEWDLQSVRSMQVEEELRRHYSFAFQLTHLTRAKDSLVHDDRLDAVAGACAYFAEDVQAAGSDTDKQLEVLDYERRLEEFEEWLANAETVSGKKPSAPDRRIRARLPTAR